MPPGFSNFKSVQGVLFNFKARKLINQILPETNGSEFENKSVNLYSGIDPTATSLHIGNLLVLMGLMRWEYYGHKIHIVIGGATAMLGDPSGVTRERSEIPSLTLQHNFNLIKKNIENIFSNYLQKLNRENMPRIHNNMNWYEDKMLIDFIVDTGKYFRMGKMLRKEYIRNKIHSSGEGGLSFKEFCYQIFQSYDWYHLYKNYECIFQIGGSDQMGNMEAGYELIKQRLNEVAHCITMPLLTSRKGEKYSKSQGQVVWLDPSQTPPYHFYQHFIRLPDDEVENYLNYLTFTEPKDLKEIINQSKLIPEKRDAHSHLANEVTELVHGKHVLGLCQRSTKIIYNPKLNLNHSEFWDLSLNSPQDIFTIVKTLGFEVSFYLKHQFVVSCTDPLLINHNRHVKKVESLPEMIFINSQITIKDVLQKLPPNEHISQETDMERLIQSKALRINGFLIDDLDQALNPRTMLFHLQRLNRDNVPILDIYHENEITRICLVPRDTLSEYVSVLKIGKRDYRLIHWILPTSITSFMTDPINNFNIRSKTPS